MAQFKGQRHNLSDKFVDGLTPPEKGSKRYYDTKVRELAVRITYAGGRSFELAYRFGGEERHGVIGKRKKGWTTEGARKQARIYLADVENGKDPFVVKRAKKAAAKAEEAAREDGRDLFPTIVGNYMKLYEAGRGGRRKTPKERTVDEIRRLFRPLETGVWKEKRIQDITKRDVRELLDEIADRAPFMANRVYAALWSLFDWAVRRDIVEASPVVWDKAAEPSRDRVLDDDEIRLFWQATAELAEPFPAIFRLLLLTGQRRSEVAEMAEAEINGEIWTLPAARAKNGREHIVPLSEQALTALAGASRQANDKGLIFANSRGKAPSNAAFADAMAACREKMNELAGRELPDWRLHDLRRTAATHMAEMDVDPHIVEAVLNHVSGARSGVAGVYNRATYFKQKRAALAAWGRHVLALVEGRTDDGVVVPFKEGAA